MCNPSVLEGQIRECFGRVVYTHKAHEKMADQCAKKLRVYKLLQIGISAFTACGAATIIFSNDARLKIATAICSFASVWVSGYMKNMDPGGTAQKHRDAAAMLWPIRESYLSLLTDLRSGAVGYGDAVKRRDDLQESLASVYKGIPQTNSRSYSEAQKALKRDEELTFSQAEIDAFLPESLRNGPRK